MDDDRHLYLVDGYNALLAADPDVRRLDGDDFRAAREQFTHWLAARVVASGLRVAVVFDAPESGAPAPRGEAPAGIEVRFAAGAAEADDWIVARARQRARRGARTSVVTADRGIARRLPARMVEVVEPKRWLAGLAAAPDEEPPPDVDLDEIEREMARRARADTSRLPRRTPPPTAPSPAPRSRPPVSEPDSPPDAAAARGRILAEQRRARRRRRWERAQARRRGLHRR